MDEKKKKKTLKFHKNSMLVADQIFKYHNSISSLSVVY